MQAHALMRLASKVYNTPHLITPSAFSVILKYLEKRNSISFRMDDMAGVPGGKKGDDDEGEDNQNADTEDNSIEIVGSVAILEVEGTLTYKPIETMCGEVGVSYQSLVENTQKIADMGLKTIIMEVNSGGGEASHVFQACEDIRKICDDYGISLIGYADTNACSAAYALLCICDQVIINPSAYAGSIGCVVCLEDESVAMEKEGVKRIFISAGDSKVPFAEDGSYKKEFLDGLQAEVDKLNAEFVAHVSKYTGLGTKTILGFQAKVFNAQDAVAVGLANSIMTNREFAEFMQLSQREVYEI